MYLNTIVVTVNIMKPDVLVAIATQRKLRDVRGGKYGVATFAVPTSTDAVLHLHSGYLWTTLIVEHGSATTVHRFIRPVRLGYATDTTKPS
jgi:hypothetical protein